MNLLIQNSKRLAEPCLHKLTHEWVWQRKLMYWSELEVNWLNLYVYHPPHSLNFSTCSFLLIFVLVKMHNDMFCLLTKLKIKPDNFSLIEFEHSEFNNKFSSFNHIFFRPFLTNQFKNDNLTFRPLEHSLWSSN